MRTVGLLVAAFVAVVASGLLHGYWTDRRRSSPALAEAGARLGQVATTLGEWDGRPLELDERLVERTEATAHLVRSYEKRGRPPVSVMLLCGHPGPISVHTPDVCYAAAGYEMTGRPAHFTAEAAGSGTRADFLVSTFRKDGGANPQYLRIFWAWSAPGGPWQAPANPRVTFAAAPALFKLYVIRELGSPDERVEDDPALDLLRRLLADLEHPPGGDA